MTSTMLKKTNFLLFFALLASLVLRPLAVYAQDCASGSPAHASIAQNPISQGKSLSECPKSSHDLFRFLEKSKDHSDPMILRVSQARETLLKRGFNGQRPSFADSTPHRFLVLRI